MGVCGKYSVVETQIVVIVVDKHVVYKTLTENENV